MQQFTITTDEAAVIYKGLLREVQYLVHNTELTEIFAKYSTEFIATLQTMPKSFLDELIQNTFLNYISEEVQMLYKFVELAEIESFHSLQLNLYSYAKEYAKITNE